MLLCSSLVMLMTPRLLRKVPGGGTVSICWQRNLLMKFWRRSAAALTDLSLIRSEIHLPVC
jgi:hypothetical protein